MNFANIAALWYLLPLGGVIILLYLLKMRRKEFKVPATFLWPRMTTEVRANSLLQKLKFSWLMVLQLIALSLLVLSLARPQTQQEGLAGTVTVFVIDTSASMSAREEGGTRFDQAVARIRSAVETARPGDRFSLVEAGDTPRVALPLSRDVSRMRSALDSLAPTDTACGMGGAMRLAAALVGAQQSGHIVLMSDGAFEKVDDFSHGKASVHFQQVGKSSNNVAITAMGVGASSSGKQVYCGLHNFDDSSKSVTLSLYADGSVFDSKRIDVEPGRTAGSTSTLPPAARVVEARIDVDDILESDNQAFALADPGAALRVLLVTKGNLFLERALALDPRVTLDKAVTVPDSELERASGSGVYDVVVFDGIAQVPVKARGVLNFAAAGDGSIVDVSGKIDKPRVTSVDHESPLMSYVDLSWTFIDKGENVKARPGAKVIADSNRGPIIVASDVSKNQIYVAFSVLDSDFSMQVGFPIFISNALDFMGGKATSDALAVRSGRPLSFPASTENTGVLTFPNDANVQIEPAAGSYVLRNLARTGKYVFRNGDKNTAIYCSLLNEQESNIAPADLQFGEGKVVAAKAPARIADYWQPIMILCLAVLACEWWLFARKS